MKKALLLPSVILALFVISYASANSETSQKGISVCVIPDKEVYGVGETINFTIKVENSGTASVTFQFPTTCWFDYWIDDGFSFLYSGVFCNTLYFEFDLLPGQSFQESFTHKPAQYYLYPGYHTITGIVNGYEYYAGFTEILVVEKHTVDLPAGWSGISSYLAPHNSDIINIFSSVEDELIMLNNFTTVYSPVLNIIPELPWDQSSGYFVKLVEPVQFVFYGDPIEINSIQLSVGWNLIPVIRNCSYNCQAIFNGLDVEIVKEAVGCHVYWPDKQIYTLQTLEPGKAYLVKANQNFFLSF
ncbi:MAG: hypothetical protein EOM76_04155 [Sphingobacteriia bacterium]|nr:hypothetical protein [Sphingobacteriia bacterium]